MPGTVVGIAILMGLTRFERIKLLKTVCVYVCMALPLALSLRERERAYQNIKQVMFNLLRMEVVNLHFQDGNKTEETWYLAYCWREG